MAFINVGVTATNSPNRATEGQKHIVEPTSSGVEYPVRPTGCLDCIHVEDHNLCRLIGTKIPFSKTTSNIIPSQYRMEVGDLNKIQQAVFVSHLAVHNGILIAPYNAGSAASGNNAMQATSNRITGVSGNTLSLNGPNPKGVNLGTFRENPAWPLADPETGSFARLIPEDKFTEIPTGAIVEFLYPSIYAGRFFPAVMSFNTPSSNSIGDVNFSVELTESASNALTPYDASMSVQDYYCRIHWYSIYPQYWLDLQEYAELKWTTNSITTSSASSINLTKTDGSATPVIYPNQDNVDENAFADGPFKVTLTENGVDTVLSDADVLSRIETSQTGRQQWSTTFDLTGLDFDSAKIEYFCLAVSTDDFAKPRITQCKHAKKDPTGSYIHDLEQRCSNVQNANLYTNFKDGCYQPGCSGFEEDEDAGKPTELGFFSGRLLLRTDWILNQNLAGFSGSLNYNLQRPAFGGPSLAEIIGSLKDDVPVDLEAYKASWFTPKAGQLEEWTDEDGNENFSIVHGGFIREATDLSSLGGPDLSQSTKTPDKGVYNYDDYYPKKNNNVFLGRNNIGDSWSYTGGFENYIPEKENDLDSWVVAVDVTVEDSQLKTEIENALNVL